MNSKTENVPPIAKCALLSMLPKPKKGGGGGQFLQAKKLPISMTALQPKVTVKQQQSWKNEAMDDDEEFDTKLAQKAAQIRRQIGDEEADVGDDSSGSEEGPARPERQPLGGGQNAPNSLGKAVAQITLNRPLLGIDYEDSSEDDEAANDNGSPMQQDFFGLLSTSPPVEKRAKMDEEEDQYHQFFIDEIAPGPSRPTAYQQTVAMGQEATADGQHFSAKNVRAISDEQAQKLIYEKELAPFGANPLIAQDAVSQLVDVSVDNALGPNVRENLLKNLSGKQLAQLPLGPMPKMKKSDSDKLAKRKHQITHLATVAVSREEQLKDKWADSKQTKKMSRQKYGF